MTGVETTVHVWGSLAKTLSMRIKTRDIVWGSKHMMILNMRIETHMILDIRIETHDFEHEDRNTHVEQKIKPHDLDMRFGHHHNTMCYIAIEPVMGRCRT